MNRDKLRLPGRLEEEVLELRRKVAELEKGQDMTVYGPYNPGVGYEIFPSTVRSVVYQILDHIGLKQEPVTPVKAGARLVPK